MAEVLSATVSGSTLTVTFDEAMTKSAWDGIHFYSSSGSPITLSNATGFGTSTWTLTLPSSVATTDYVIVEAYGGAAYGTSTNNLISQGTLFVGGSGNTNFDVNNGNWPYGGPYSFFGNGGADTIRTPDWQEDAVYLNESVKSPDVVSYSGFYGDNGDIFQSDEIKGFDVTGTSTNDQLSLNSKLIAADASNVNGIDVGAIASHSISGGIVTFKDTLGNIIILKDDGSPFADAQMGDVYNYLNTNIALTGTTVGVQTNDGLLVFQKGTPGHDSLITFLVGISNVTLSNSAGTNTVQIVDTTAPDLTGAVMTSTGVDLHAWETLQSASVQNAKLYKNGTIDMGAVTVSVNGATISLTSSTQTLAATDFVVADFSDPSFSLTLTDPSGNNQTIVPAGMDMHKLAAGGAGNNTIDLATLSGVNNVIGGDGNDSLTGASLSVDLDLEGGNGNDTLIGGSGADWISGDAGDDVIKGGAGNDSLNGNAGADTIFGGAGDDWIDGGTITDKIGGTDFNLLNFSDIISTTAPVTVNLEWGSSTGTASGNDYFKNINMVIGTAGNDSITGSSSALVLEQIEGGLGNDSLDGGAITDTLNYENSNRVSYQNSTGAVTVDLLAGTATGGEGNDTLSNFNQVRGSAYADTLYGSNSELTERFEGLAGNDNIDGRGGFDYVAYDRSTSAVTVNLATGTASDSFGGTDTLANIEGIRGSAYNDVLTGGLAANGVTINDGLSEVFIGGAGNDTIDGGQGYDLASYSTSTSGVVVTLNGSLDGTASDSFGGTDVLRNIEGVRGSQFNDTLTGSDTAAFESFEGGQGNDVIDGKGGIDRADYKWSVAGVTVNLATGTASDGYGSTDTLSNIENVRGSRDFNDSIIGSSANNKLEGLGGNDTLDGGTGIDTAVFSGLKSDYTVTRSGSTWTVTDTNFADGNDGTDTLTNVELLQFSDGVRSLKSATDLNGEGSSDILWRNTSTGVNAAWNAGNSGSTLSVAAISDANWKVAGIGDFNGDGKSDTLWRNGSTGANAIWNGGNSSTTLGVSGVPDTNWTVAGVGDFNGDGQSDILWRNTSTGADAIWGAGNNSTPLPVSGVGDTTWKVAGIGDFNGDGKSDILWRNSSTGANAIWNAGNNATTLAINGVPDVTWTVAGVGDFNGDGQSDILWRNSTSGADAIWLTGNSGTTQAVASLTDTNWKVANIGDYNSDGKDDILWRNTQTGADTIWLAGNSSTTQAVSTQTGNWAVFNQSTSTTLTTTSKPVQSDFNGDGKSDLLWRNASTGADAIWNAGDSSTSLSVVGVPDANWKVAGTGDFNGDGKSDILWRNASTGADAIWNAGDSTSSLSVSGVSDLNWKVAGIGDFNGDGKSDILWRNASTGIDAIWNAGDSTTGLSIVGVPDVNWKVAGIGDFNGDGKSDILWRNASTGADAIWNAGDSSTSLSVSGVPDVNWQVAGIGDFNGDGKSDILWRNASTGADAIWNAGDSSTGLSVVGVPDLNWKVAGTGDYNGDGKSDILWRNASTGADAIWSAGDSSTGLSVGGVPDTNWGAPAQTNTWLTAAGGYPV